MPRERKIGPLIFNAAIFILLEIAALNMLRHNSELQNLWLSRLSHTVMAKVWGGSDNLRHYFSLNKENERLAQENAILNQQLKEYRDREDQSYSDSLTAELKAYGDYVYAPATIVKISRNKQHNYFIINKGSEDGVRPQSGIITNRGVVGIIDAVDKHYSYGLSFMNSDISVSSRIGKEGAVGPLSWDGKSVDKALLKEIPLQFKYAPGDTVWTSGYSAIFPPDIPLGIAGGAKIVNGATNNIDVTLFQDFTALRYVTVVHNTALKEMEALEK
jgi:rod shape-determining protein MreC